jgi:hypothetical protein
LGVDLVSDDPARKGTSFNPVVSTRPSDTQARTIARGSKARDVIEKANYSINSDEEVDLQRSTQSMKSQ